MLDITFVSDYVCPYCLLAKEALKQVLAETGIEARITWQPLELGRRPPKPAPVTPPSDEERAERMRQLKEAAYSLHLDMKMPPRVGRPQTRLAFEGWRYACDMGKGEEWNDLMYRAYFIEELDIGEVSVLRQLAERIGLDADGLNAALEDGRYTEAQTEAHRYALEDLKAFYVPTIYVNGVQTTPEAYTKADMLDILLGNLGEGGGLHCDADGNCNA